MANINWNSTAEDDVLVKKIVDRYIELLDGDRARTTPFDCQGLEMDIIAVHLNGCPLDLEKLLAAPDADFEHDVSGISSYTNRTTGKLTNCFLPRCARPE
jgi:hypothetical protein